MLSEFGQVRDWLSFTWRLTVPDDWLSACIEWVHSENEGCPLTFENLCNLIFDQWLLCDLRDIGASCLPSDLNQLEKYQLEGSFGLQINSLVDISCPLFGQIQKMTGTENENVNVTASTQQTQLTQQSAQREAKANRVLLLKMTDGSQDIQGMEYKPVSMLNINLSLGTKILIHGSVLCRRGVLMLKQENVTVLGGEVESLAEDMNTQKIAELHLRSNIESGQQNQQMPRKVFDKSDVKKVSVRSDRRINSHNPQANVYNKNTYPRFMKAEVKSEAPDDLDTDLTDDALLEAATNVDYEYSAASTSAQVGSSLPRHQIVNSRSERFPSGNKRPSNEWTNAGSLVEKKSKIDSSWGEDDDIDFDDDIDWQNSALLDPSNENASDGQRNSSSNLVGQSNHRSSASMNPYEQRSRISQGTSTSCSSGMSNRTSSTSSSFTAESFARRQTTPTNQGESRVTNPASCGQQSISQRHMQLSSITRHQTPPVNTPISNAVNFSNNNIVQPCSSKSVSSQAFDENRPFTYLQLILNGRKKGIFCVKAFISTVVGRLEHNGGENWSLSAKINDGSASLDVRLSDQMLSSLIGFSASECMKMREVAKTDMSIREQLTKGIKQCQDALVKLSAIFELEIPSNGSMPWLRQFRPVTQTDIQQLKDQTIAKRELLQFS